MLPKDTSCAGITLPGNSEPYGLPKIMKETATTQSDVSSRILEVIKEDFHNDFMDVYALTISLTDKHPEQANNEIRNALNHLARALMIDTPQDALEQITKAQGHIERAKRDCLKISLINRHKIIVDAAYRLRVRFETP